MLILCIADVERDVGMKNLSPKEAITILEGMRIDIPVPKAAVTQIKRNLALDMAINALNCSEIPNNSDTISKQQAIDALRGYLVGKRCPDDGTLTCRLIENEVINKLPSVQPERKTGHWIAITSRNNTYKCSVCGRLLTNITDGKNKVAKNYPYCHCGADMRGGENDGCSQVFEREESDV